MTYIAIRRSNVGWNVGSTLGRGLHKLSATQVSKVKEPGYYGDGGGLWLQVTASGAKSWIFRFTRNKRAREMGLGGLVALSLADAREEAAKCRRQLVAGVDPIEARKTLRLSSLAAAAKVVTFDKAAEDFISSHRAEWRNAKHGDQWTNTLATYASPVLGALAVSDIETGHVLRVLEPIWTTKTETAMRVRGRIEAVLDWCTVRGYRGGENPARWRGHLDHVLPAPAKIAKPENHAALPYREIGDFLVALRAQPGTAARAVELIILTASRTSEVLNAARSEIDLAARVWTIPPERMKSGRQHRVPLSDAAVRLIEQAPAEDGSDYLFPGAKQGKPLSNMAGLKLLERMGRDDLTVHGFRSTFRDWAAEQTNFPREVAEAALAHIVKDKAEAAYQRGDLLEKRAKLMQAWAEYCERPTKAAEVIPMKNRAGR